MRRWALLFVVLSGLLAVRPDAAAAQVVGAGPPPGESGAGWPAVPGRTTPRPQAGLECSSRLATRVAPARPWTPTGVARLVRHDAFPVSTSADAGRARPAPLPKACERGVLRVVPRATGGRPWGRNAATGALVGGGLGAVGAYVLIRRANVVGDPRAAALVGGVYGAALGAVIGLVWTAAR